MIFCAATPLIAGEDVAVSDLPQAVVDALKKRFSGAELLSAEKDTEKGQLYYEVKLRDKEGLWEVEVSPDGKILDVDKED